jgi:hypothetical protein
MAWVETTSLSFTARHDDDHTDDALAVLDSLEEHRNRLERLFPQLPENVTVVLHDSSLQLTLAQPWLAGYRRLASPAARRYMSGWFAQGEVHALAPERLSELAGGPDSREALMLTPHRAYTMLVIGTNNPMLPPPARPRTILQLLRAPWLLEGAAQHLSGQVPLLRAAIATRLREGGVPFPPSRRDAPLLAGTLFDLLARDRGIEACARLARQPSTHPLHALESAFGQRAPEIASRWRAHLERAAAPAAHVNVLG